MAKAKKATMTREQFARSEAEREYKKRLRANKRAGKKGKAPGELARARKEGTEAATRTYKTLGGKLDTTPRAKRNAARKESRLFQNRQSISLSGKNTH